jgi:hypothetical protein
MAKAAKGDNRERFIERTLEVWQPRSAHRLTEEGAREIAENVTGFFEVLQGWAQAEKRVEHSHGNGGGSIATEKGRERCRPTTG